MRIIAGKFRSRRLERPATSKTRPVPDRVRESIFSMLGHHYGCPGELPPLRVADVFAGSGSMGLEALSRGAKHCTFFERGRTALRTLRTNIETMGVSEDTLILSRDAWHDVQINCGDEIFSLIFLDPPYSDSCDTDPGGRVSKLLVELGKSPIAGRLVVLHHERRVDYSRTQVETWRGIDHRVGGTNGITLFEQ